MKQLLSPSCSITISDLLERKAGEQAHHKGFDLADYLVQHPVSEFQ